MERKQAKEATKRFEIPHNQVAANLYGANLLTKLLHVDVLLFIFCEYMPPFKVMLTFIGLEIRIKTHCDVVL